MFHSLRSLFATTISTEPVILFLNLGVGIVYGSGLPTYLQGVNSIDILNLWHNKQGHILGQIQY